MEISAISIAYSSLLSIKLRHENKRSRSRVFDIRDVENARRVARRSDFEEIGRLFRASVTCYPRPLPRHELMYAVDCMPLGDLRQNVA